MQDLSGNFLYEFTKELILNSAPAYLRDKELDMQEKELKIKKDVEQKLEKPIYNQQKTPIIQKPEYVQINKPNIYIQKDNAYQNQNLNKNEPVRSESEELQGIQLGPIRGMINDLNVISIECPGPNKFIIISTLTKVIPTQIMLNKNEINRIIESFSIESKIPRIGGVFKAIVNNLVITAIDSEYAGPKFIISKIRGNPSQFL